MNQRSLSNLDFEYILSPKYKNYLLKSFTYVFNILEGTVRAGKDMISSIAFIEHVISINYNKFLVAAKNISQAITILSDYMIGYFNTEYGTKGLGYAELSKYGGSSPAIKINYKGKIKWIIFKSGGNSGDDLIIKGVTYAGAYLTEINDLTPEFIKQALQRCSISGSKIFGTLNPKNEKHWFYTDYLRIWYNEQLEHPEKHWLNYDKFVMDDNPGLSEETKYRIKHSYDPNSVMYKRDILGMRCDAEGSIYTINEDNILENYSPLKYLRYITIADFGETISATYFGCYALTFNDVSKQLELHVLKEYHHINSNNKNNMNFKYLSDYADDYVNFVKDCSRLFNKAPMAILYDGTTEAFYSIRNSLNKNNLGNIIPRFVLKEDNQTRIQEGQNALYNRKLRIYKECKHIREDLENAVYDSDLYERSGKFERRKDFTASGHADALDSLEYALTYFKRDLNI